MIEREEIFEIVRKYKKPTVGVLGSHSALEIAHGAKQEGLKTAVVCERGREKTYTKYYKNLFDYALVLDKFADIVKEENQEKLRRLNTIFLPSRSFSVYLGYGNIEDKFFVPIMGSRYLLRTEERNEPKNQYYILKKAGIKMPRRFKPEEIDCPAIVKVLEKGSIERAFFFASSPEEFKQKAWGLIEKGIIDEESLKNAVIEEYILGAKFNANYFSSPLNSEIELLGFDRRIQTNIDGILDLPAEEQLGLRGKQIQNVEIGHYGATLRESQLEKIFDAGEKFTEACEKEFPPGMIGLFALQGAIDKTLDFYVFDVSPRIPGCPCVEPTSPYMKYKYGKEVGPGRRAAIEIKAAVKKKKLGEIVT